MPSGQALGKWAPDAADPAVGRRCLRLAATGGGGDGDWSRLELFGPWRSLPPGRFHTFSILLRADRDSVPVLLRIQNGVIHGLLEQGLGTGQGLRRTVLVGREWRRYFIGGPLPSAFRDACRVHVGVPHGATVWADDAVLLPGPERPAAPGGLEAAAALDASGACLDVGRPAEGTVLLHNAGAGAPLRCALEWRIAPRDGDALAQGSEEAILEPGDTKTFAVRSPALARRGPYRLTVAATAGDRRGTAEAPFVVIQPLRDVAPDSPFLLHDGGAQLLSDLDRVRRIGAVSIRCAATTTWVSVEPREGQWEWRDTYHRRFFDNGLSLLGLLGFAPAWARGDASAFHWRETRVPPADLTRWAQYVE